MSPEREGQVGLLVLHLEVRVHCFHYLHAIWRGPAGAGFFGGQDSTDPNAEVTKLTQDLLQIEEELTSSLQVIMNTGSRKALGPHLYPRIGCCNFALI